MTDKIKCIEKSKQDKFDFLRQGLNAVFVIDDHKKDGY